METKQPTTIEDPINEATKAARDMVLSDLTILGLHERGACIRYFVEGAKWLAKKQNEQ